MLCSCCLLIFPVLTSVLKLLQGTGDHKGANVNAYFKSLSDLFCFLNTMNVLMVTSTSHLLTFANCLSAASLALQLSRRAAISKSAPNFLDKQLTGFILQLPGKLQMYFKRSAIRLGSSFSLGRTFKIFTNFLFSLSGWIQLSCLLKMTQFEMSSSRRSRRFLT